MRPTNTTNSWVATLLQYYWIRCKVTLTPLIIRSYGKKLKIKSTFNFLFFFSFQKEKVKVKIKATYPCVLPHYKYPSELYQKPSIQTIQIISYHLSSNRFHENVTFISLCGVNPANWGWSSRTVNGSHV